MFDDSRRSGVRKPVIVEISSKATKVKTVKVAWFPPKLPQREDAIVLQQSTLLDIAREMTEREERYLQTQGESSTGTDWEKLARSIQFRKRDADGHIGKVN